MQTRTITVDYARPRGYDIGYRAENNFTLLALPIPAELEGADSYRVYFESTVGEYLQTEPLTPADGYVTVKITSDVVPEPGNMAAQLVAFSDGEIVGYAPMITGSAKVSIPDGTERLSHSLAAEIALNTAARHTHANKSVLDKFAETDGKPTYNGEALGGGGAAGDITAEDVGYTLPEDVQTTFPDIELESDTVKSGLDVAIYYALAGMFAKYIQCDAQTAEGTITTELQSVLDGFVFPAMAKAHEHANKDTLDKFGETDGKPTYNGEPIGGGSVGDITAEDVSYSNSLFGEEGPENVGQALDILITGSIATREDVSRLNESEHTHANKNTLDKLSDSNGKLQYNGSDVGLKGDKGDTPVKGTDYWTESDKAEIVADTLAALPTWTGGSY